MRHHIHHQNAQVSLSQCISQIPAKVKKEALHKHSPQRLFTWQILNSPFVAEVLSPSIWYVTDKPQYPTVYGL